MNAKVVGIEAVDVGRNNALDFWSDARKNGDNIDLRTTLDEMRC